MVFATCAMQFKRKYKLIIGEQGGTGREITDLKISFRIYKDLTTKTNKSTIDIYNLSKTTREKFNEQDLVCILQAGYEGTSIKRIFIGNVTYVTHATQGAEVITRLELSDGQVAIRDTVVSLSYGVSTTSGKIISDIANQMGLSLSLASDVENRTYANGFSFVGLGKDALSKVTAGSGSEWSVQNGVLQVIKSGGNTSRKALSFSSESGLIGSPSRKNRSKAKPSSETETSEEQALWKIKTLLAPTASVGDLVYVDSLSIVGWFTIKSLKHKGDNYGSNWYSEMELIYSGE